MDDVTRLLQTLVRIPSINPMGRGLEGAHLFEAGVTRFLEEFFGGLGVEYDRIELAPGRANIIARFEPPGLRRTLLFDVHQDTVPVDGMTIDPFGGVIDGGRLYGRGACDVKGSMAAMLVAFARLVQERPAGSASVVMAFTVDEEYTHIGSSALANGPKIADLAVVAEPTKLDLVASHKGAVRWKIRTVGVACHSSTPHLGHNAIYRMAPVIAALEDHAAELERSPADPILGPPSLSVGRIEGGQSVNIVPDWCAIEVDRRLIPGEDPRTIPATVREALAARLGPADWIAFDEPWVNMPALAPNVPDQDLARLSDAVEAVTGRKPAVGGVPFGTDAGPLGAAGLPCIVFGPGDIAQAHTKDEWIDLDEVRAAAEIYYEMALRVG